MYLFFVALWVEFSKTFLFEFATNFYDLTLSKSVCWSLHYITVHVRPRLLFIGYIIGIFIQVWSEWCSVFEICLFVNNAIVRKVMEGFIIIIWWIYLFLFVFFIPRVKRDLDVYLKKINYNFSKILIFLNFNEIESKTILFILT